MYRTSSEYERMVDLAIDVIVDYDIKTYPINMFDLCEKMVFFIVPYSAFDDKVELLMKKSIDGFSIPMSVLWNPTIFYNNKYGSHLTSARISHTIAHEIKHLLDGDTDDSEDDLCDYFAKYLRCPIPYVIYLDIKSELELVSKFQISMQQARYIMSNLSNRKQKYGNKFFYKEVKLLKQLLGDSLHEENLQFCG